MGTKNYFKLLFGFLFTILIMGSVFADVASSINPVGGFARSESTYANIATINALLGDSSFTDTAAEKESEALEGYDFSTIVAISATKESEALEYFDFSIIEATSAVKESEALEGYNFSTTEATSAVKESKVITQFNYAGDQRVFTVNDGTNTDTITLNADYEDLAGLVDALNTQILTAGITATAGETNTFILTSTATGDGAVITVAGANVGAFFTGDLTVNGSDEVERAKTFTVNDGTNTDTITLDADYEDLAGLVEALNTQISTAGITATAGETNTFILTNNETGFETTLVLAGDDVADFFTGDLTINGTTDTSKKLEIKVDGGETQTKTFDANYLDKEGAFANWDAFLTAINFTSATETASDGANIKITSSSTGIDSNVTIITDDAGLFEIPFEIHGFDDSYSLSEGWNLVSPAYFIDANNSTIYDGDPTKIYKHTKDGFLTADVEDLSPVDAIFIKTNNATTVLGMNFAEEDPDDAIVMDEKELTTGWNLISVPYNMQSNTINQAFAQLIEGSNLGLTTVYNWYNSNIITDWATGLNYDQGYWVNMNQDDWYSQPVAIVVEE